MKPMIHSTKHYVQMSRFTVGAQAVVTQDLVIAVESTVANLVDEVEEGAGVKAVFVELWGIDAGNDGAAVAIIVKTPIANTGPTFSNMNALGVFNN